MNVFQFPAPGNALPAVNWQAGGAGSEAQLTKIPDQKNKGGTIDAVWRANPKAN